MAYIGQAVSGLFDGKLVSGRGEYTADVSLPGMGSMAVARRHVAHARLVRVDTARTLRDPSPRSG